MWPWQEYYDVKWLNKPVKGTAELAVVNNPVPDDQDSCCMGYGARPVEKHYSHLVILAQVQRFADREVLDA